MLPVRLVLATRHTERKSSLSWRKTKSMRILWSMSSASTGANSGSLEAAKRCAQALYANGGNVRFRKEKKLALTAGTNSVGCHCHFMGHTRGASESWQSRGDPRERSCLRVTSKIHSPFTRVPENSTTKGGLSKGEEPRSGAQGKDLQSRSMSEKWNHEVRDVLVMLRSGPGQAVLRQEEACYGIGGSLVTWPQFP